MKRTIHYCDLCNNEKLKNELFDVALQLTERTNSNLQGQRTISNKEICRECLEYEGIVPTNKRTHEIFGLKRYDQDNGTKPTVELIKKWFKK